MSLDVRAIWATASLRFISGKVVACRGIPAINLAAKYYLISSLRFREAISRFAGRHGRKTGKIIICRLLPRYSGSSASTLKYGPLYSAFVDSPFCTRVPDPGEYITALSPLRCLRFYGAEISNCFRDYRYPGGRSIRRSIPRSIGRSIRPSRLVTFKREPRKIPSSRIEYLIPSIVLGGRG